MKQLKLPPFRTPSASVMRKVQRLARRCKGKIAAIEPKTGEYFVGDTFFVALDKARKRFPQGFFYFIRSGYAALDFHWGALQTVVRDIPFASRNWARRG